MTDIKICVACREPHYDLSPARRCERCYGEELANERLARDMNRAEELRKEADSSFKALKEQFGDFDEN